MDPSYTIPALPVYGFRPDLGGLLGLILTVVLPLLAGLLMKRSWNAATKGTVLLALAAIKTLVEGYLQAVNTGVHLDGVALTITTVVNFVIAVALHFGLWRGSGIQQAAIDSGVRDPRP